MQSIARRQDAQNWRICPWPSPINVLALYAYRQMRRLRRRYTERGQERLYAEAKGRTAAIGLDVDTLYGHSSGG